MGSKILSAPSGEPLTLNEAKNHLRVDIGDDDGLISGLIVAARQQAETICRRALVTQSWAVVFDQFPRPGYNIGSANWYGPQWGMSPGPLTSLALDGKTGYEIYLPLPPLQSVDEISYVDPDGVNQVFTSFIADLYSEPARAVPAYGSTWPATRNQINAVKIKFTCGYGTPSEVPQGIKQWMLALIGMMYEIRESEVVVQRATLITMSKFDGLLDPYRVISY